MASCNLCPAQFSRWAVIKAPDVGSLVGDYLATSKISSRGKMTYCVELENNELYAHGSNALLLFVSGKFFVGRV